MQFYKCDADDRAYYYDGRLRYHVSWNDYVYFTGSSEVKRIINISCDSLNAVPVAPIMISRDMTGLRMIPEIPNYVNIKTAGSNKIFFYDNGTKAEYGTPLSSAMAANLRTLTSARNPIYLNPDLLNSIPAAPAILRAPGNAPTMSTSNKKMAEMEAPNPPTGIAPTIQAQYQALAGVLAPGIRIPIPNAAPAFQPGSQPIDSEQQPTTPGPQPDIQTIPDTVSNPPKPQPQLQPVPVIISQPTKSAGFGWNTIKEYWYVIVILFILLIVAALATYTSRFRATNGVK